MKSMKVLILLACFVVVNLGCDARDIHKKAKSISKLRKEAAERGLVKKEDWPKILHQLEGEITRASDGDSKLSVCWPLPRVESGRKIMLCKITNWTRCWRSVQQKLELKPALESDTSMWRMKSSSLRDDPQWWPTFGDSALYFVNQNFVDSNEDIHFQAARIKDKELYIHCTLPEKK